MEKSLTTNLRVAGSKPLDGDRFLYKSQFDHVLSVLTKISESIVWFSSQNFRALTAVLLPLIRLSLQALS